jgi:leucyl-tRNA synthetase
MEFVNYLQSYKGDNRKVLRESIENLILLLSPFTPFIADTLWREIGNEGFTVEQPFPEYDEEALKEESIEIPVQINGKVRGKIKIDVNASEEDIKNLVLQDERFKKWIEGKEIKHIKYIKGKIFTIAVK